MKANYSSTINSDEYVASLFTAGINKNQEYRIDENISILSTGYTIDIKSESYNDKGSDDSAWVEPMFTIKYYYDNNSNYVAKSYNPAEVSYLSMYGLSTSFGCTYVTEGFYHNFDVLIPSNTITCLTFTSLYDLTFSSNTSIVTLRKKKNIIGCIIATNL